jgi:AAA family ATP:ADP antiporter
VNKTAHFSCYYLSIITDPLFGLGANVALIFSGQYVRWVSGLRASLAPGVDPWSVSLRYLMGAVVASGGVLLATYTWMLKNVVDKSAVAIAAKKAPKKKKVKMSLGESAKFLMSSPYIRNLATLVISYGMCINLVEVSWKAKIKVRSTSLCYHLLRGSFIDSYHVANRLFLPTSYQLDGLP